MKTINHIIFISNEVANGGSGRVISVLANSFINRGYQVSVYSFNNRYETYPMDKLVKQIFLKIRYKQKLMNKLDRIMQLRNVFKRNPGASIIAFEYFVNMQTIAAGLGLKNKIIISERNDPAQQENRKIIKHMRSFLYYFADSLVCQTPDARAYFPKAVQKKTNIIANPIMAGLPEPIRGERRKEIVNFGRFEKQKNLLLLIDAFALLYKEHPEYKLSLYGDGNEKNRIETYIDEKHLRDCISLHGSTPDIHNKILDCAMFVSSSDYEGLSNSMLEAMALGLPCIVTDCPCGGARMMINSYENGILVPVRDVKAMYEAMKYMIENPEKAAAISKNTAKVRLDLAVSKIVTEWERVI
ncbi:MAG: glycosyltransferase [Syntrophomonas sp.]